MLQVCWAGTHVSSLALILNIFLHMKPDKGLNELPSVLEIFGL